MARACEVKDDLVRLVDIQGSIDNGAAVFGSHRQQILEVAASILSLLKPEVESKSTACTPRKGVE